MRDSFVVHLPVCCLPACPPAYACSMRNKSIPLRDNSLGFALMVCAFIFQARQQNSIFTIFAIRKTRLLLLYGENMLCWNDEFANRQKYLIIFNKMNLYPLAGVLRFLVQSFARFREKMEWSMHAYTEHTQIHTHTYTQMYIYICGQQAMSGLEERVAIINNTRCVWFL